MLRPERLKDSALVACNIYVSTASRKVLTPLFVLAQSHPAALLVHSFVDHTYNRSSFHWAGLADSIAHVTTLVAQAMLDDRTTTLVSSTTSRCTTTAASTTTKKNDADDDHQHPSVGMVDHIAVLPLHDDDDDASWVTSTTAKRIGSSLEDQQTVLYYGGAHPEAYSLAHVRRTQTDFFRTKNSSSQGEERAYRTVVVGSPPFFVENYNIRVQQQQPARDLLRRLRTKDGGQLPHVEALALRYGNSSCWEVACNLTHPEETGVQDVDSVVDAFVQEQHGVVVQERYRVGTTAAQCREAWQQTSNSDAERRSYDDNVKQEFEQYFETLESRS